MHSCPEFDSAMVYRVIWQWAGDSEYYLAKVTDGGNVIKTWPLKSCPFCRAKL